MFALYRAADDKGLAQPDEWTRSLIAVTTTEEKGMKMAREYAQKRFHNGRRCDCNDDEPEENAPCMCFPLILNEIGEPDSFCDEQVTKQKIFYSEYDFEKPDNVCSPQTAVLPDATIPSVPQPSVPSVPQTPTHHTGPSQPIRKGAATELRVKPIDGIEKVYEDIEYGLIVQMTPDGSVVAIARKINDVTRCIIPDDQALIDKIGLLRMSEDLTEKDPDLAEELGVQVTFTKSAAKR